MESAQVYAHCAWWGARWEFFLNGQRNRHKIQIAENSPKKNCPGLVVDLLWNPIHTDAMPTSFLNSFSPSTSSSGLSETLFTRTQRKPALRALAVLLGRESRRSCSVGNPIHTEKALFIRDFLNPYTHGRSANPLSLHSLPSASTSPKPMSSGSQ